jgi:hypothetical protein
VPVARPPRPRAAVLAAVALLAGASAGDAPAASRVTALQPAGRQALDGGYVRVHGTARGVVDGDERVRGLPAAGLRYAVEYEVLRPARGARPRLLLLEAENRSSPLLLNALSGVEPGVSGPPSTAAYPRAVARILRREGLAYARVQWQTGIAASVPATAQGVGEVIVRDVARALRRTARRRALIGVSQGAFFITTFVAEGFNALPGGGRAFHQALTVDGNGNWMAINQLAGSGPQDPYVRADGRPLAFRRILRRPRTDPLLVDVANYTDFYRLRAGLTGRGRLPARVRRYDWPSPHQSFGPEVVFGGLGCNDRRAVPLSPLRYGPYLRGVVRGMARGRLPASRRFSLGPTPRTSPTFNGLPGVEIPVPRVDADGQPVGGVRFPEVELPLGRLLPVSLPPAVTTSSGAVCGNSGGYRPFSPEAVRRRYSADAYLRAYRRRLHRLERGGYVLAPDRGAMLRAAAAGYRAATG